MTGVDKGWIGGVGGATANEDTDGDDAAVTIAGDTGSC